MSNNENPMGGSRQVPVETYKCSQCNFYTNHEYYLQQHNLTHGLQALMDHRKRNSDSFDSSTQLQPYMKAQNMLDTVSIMTKILRCAQCNFETEQEAFFKQHILTHNIQFPISPYRVQVQGFENPEENFNKSFNNVGHNIPSVESFGSPMFQSENDISVKPQNQRQSVNSFDGILIKVQEVDTPALELFRCPVNYCAYETTDENDWKQHSLSHDLKTPCPEAFRCLKCDFETIQEDDMKHHIKEHEKLLEPKLLLNENIIPQVPKEIFRCNNCDYETNLKAFIKRHMLIHTVQIKAEVGVSETLKCSQCEFETEHEKFLKRHELSHKQNEYFSCEKCNFETLYKKIYLNHMQAHKIKKEKKQKEIESQVLKSKNDSIYIKCSECSFEASSKEQLDIHKKIKHTTSDDINLHKCMYCKYQTNWEPCLKRHIEREHPDGKPVKVKKEKEKTKEKVEVKIEKETKPPNNDVFRCHNCDFSSKSKQYLVLHLKRYHIKTEKPDKQKAKAEKKGKSDKSKVKVEKSQGKMHECKFRNCTFQTSIKSNYVYHLRKHQSQNPQRVMFHFCDLCDFIAKTEDNLAEHKKRMHLNHLRQVYKCSQCDFKTVFKHTLKTHSIKHKKYSCNICEEELESAFALVKHRRSHQINPKNRVYLCDVCGFQSKNERSLKMHKKTHNPEFKCPDCPFQTHSKVNFQNHCINHKSADEVTMFPCPHCSYQSRLKRNLAWHMKRHADPSKAQIFKCPSCEYQTFTNAQLKSHLMVHKSKEEVVMLQCDFCTFETKRKSNMVQHRLRHLKDSPDVPLLSCPDCNYTTVAKRHLNKHRKTHNVNPDKMFQCTYCPYKIHRKVYLMRHMENHKTLETFGNEQWQQRYTFPPQPQMHITGVTVVPNIGQNIPILGPNLL